MNTETLTSVATHLDLRFARRHRPEAQGAVRSPIPIRLGKDCNAVIWVEGKCKPQR
jgi:hypothetical protein